MTPDEHLAHLRADGHRIADLAAGDLGATVPTCPGWMLADLVEHTGFVHRWLTAAVRDAPAGFPDPSTWQHGPEGRPLADWFRAGVDDALSAMGGADADAPRWTWAGPGTVAWYQRRISQETLVHRIDAELAAGHEPGPVDPAFAVNGVDEMCDVFIPAATGQPIGGNGETLHLHATDAPGEWLLTLGADHVEVARGHDEGEAALWGPARDLLLVVWGRDPLGEVTSHGDPTVIDRFRAAARL